MTTLTLQVKETVNKTRRIANVSLAPMVDEDYWIFRVPLSENQAVVGFQKFGTVGIGFQHEIDWNTNQAAARFLGKT